MAVTATDTGNYTIEIDNGATGGSLIVTWGTGEEEVFALDQDGNINLSGSFKTAGPTVLEIRNSSSGVNVLEVVDSSGTVVSSLDDAGSFSAQNGLVLPVRPSVPSSTNWPDGSTILISDTTAGEYYLAGFLAGAWYQVPLH